MERHFDVPQGATPISDCSGLIPEWVRTSHDLNRVEAENILKAQQKYFKGSHPKSWFQPEELKTIHRAMFKEVWNWAGAYRKSITSIGIKPGLIPMRLAELCFEVNLWCETPPQLTFLEMAARIHHQLVSIHPFENGNGRFSRLIADRFLLSWKCQF
jgi:fido (protein-threonine AMPylation protein)